MRPADQLVSNKALCLAQESQQYLICLLHGCHTSIKLDHYHHQAHWFDPQTGKTEVIGEGRNLCEEVSEP